MVAVRSLESVVRVFWTIDEEYLVVFIIVQNLVEIYEVVSIC